MQRNQENRDAFFYKDNFAISKTGMRLFSYAILCQLNYFDLINTFIDNNTMHRLG